MIAERVAQFPTGNILLGNEFKAITLDMALEDTRSPTKTWSIT
ncbi:hypothetical protein MSTE_00878 [Mycobacteroides stephanolepidis]|uniref:Uncharacterized protein n=1 Tax=[Mycobacterium] stephanolepidis TaxID=1520670 RepID=A0A1Z4ETF0_9MYCO|nr:hypothetical protein MSTE_00878 [[Mycobacterium] stephanolepidis]